MKNNNVKFNGKAPDKGVQKTAEPTISGPSLADRFADVPDPVSPPISPDENAKPVDSK